MKSGKIELMPNKAGGISNTEEILPINLKGIGCEEKWKHGFTGKGVVIAVLDTGCDVNHPDLMNRVIEGYNFTEEHGGNVSIYEDTNGHGTHTAGIIAGSKDCHGIIGVAPDENSVCRRKSG
ncbi:major intracellular serine protease [Bacillus sp. OV322]|uniref:S8 family peptidase n=1 Tax=Bacillus sp. OV322 TaxID=1882764 RepID=UPI0008EF7B8E|nr:S8 family serine peptidase [Bacillus sp. OV322]SFB98757.1 major intracellular serine protease [Bacillus sp. OV322]